MEHKIDSTLDIVIKSLNNIGILIDDSDVEDLLLEDLITDSIAFISFIVELEEQLGVTIPDEYLNIESLGTCNNLVLLLESMERGGE